MMPRLFVPGTEQTRLERGLSSIGTDGLGWLTPGRKGPQIFAKYPLDSGGAGARASGFY